MIFGVMPGIWASWSGSPPDKPRISAGTEDLGKPFCRAALETLFGKRLLIVEWKMAVSESPGSAGVVLEKQS